MKVYRIIAIILLVTVGALATGVPAYFHEREHEREDAQELAAFLATHTLSPAQTPPHHEHDESNCPVCAMLRAPMIVSTTHVVLLDSGVVVYHVGTPAIHQLSQTSPTSIACRGPPAFGSSPLN